MYILILKIKRGYLEMKRTLNEITAIIKLKTDFEKLKALFILLNIDFEVAGNSLRIENRRFDFGPKTGDLTNIEDCE